MKIRAYEEHTHMESEEKMRAKQVTALMMAATLAVTGNGVTAFAEPVANVEAGGCGNRSFKR